MFKKILLLSVVISIALAGISLAAEQSKMAPTETAIKSSIVKQASALLATGPDLTPSLWVDCYTGDFGDQLEKSGFFLVKDIYVYVYNGGSQASSSAANGRIDLFDVLTNRPVSYSFTVDPTASKAFGNIRPGNSLSGIYLVKKGAGITASVTYQGKTKTSTENGCSVLI